MFIPHILQLFPKECEIPKSSTYPKNIFKMYLSRKLTVDIQLAEEPETDELVATRPTAPAIAHDARVPETRTSSPGVTVGIIMWTHRDVMGQRSGGLAMVVGASLQFNYLLWRRWRGSRKVAVFDAMMREEERGHGKSSGLWVEEKGSS